MRSGAQQALSPAQLPRPACSAGGTRAACRAWAVRAHARRGAQACIGDTRDLSMHAQRCSAGDVASTAAAPELLGRQRVCSLQIVGRPGWRMLQPAEPQRPVNLGLELGQGGLKDPRGQTCSEVACERRWLQRTAQRRKRHHDSVLAQCRGIIGLHGMRATKALNISAAMLGGLMYRAAEPQNKVRWGSIPCMHATPASEKGAAMLGGSSAGHSRTSSHGIASVGAAALPQASTARAEKTGSGAPAAIVATAAGRSGGSCVSDCAAASICTGVGASSVCLCVQTMRTA